MRTLMLLQEAAVVSAVAVDTLAFQQHEHAHAQRHDEQDGGGGAHNGAVVTAGARQQQVQEQAQQHAAACDALLQLARQGHVPTYVSLHAERVIWLVIHTLHTQKIDEFTYHIAPLPACPQCPKRHVGHQVA